MADSPLLIRGYTDRYQEEHFAVHNNVINYWKLMDTGTTENHEVISWNLKLVSVVCNTISLVFCYYLIRNLYRDIKNAKSLS